MAANQMIEDGERYEVLHENIEFTINVTRRGYVGSLKSDLEEIGFEVTKEDGTVLHVSHSQSF